MNITCIATARIPSDTANSIQVMKVCQAMAGLGHAVRLLVPGMESAAWEDLAEQYGLSTRFDVAWLPANPRLKRTDFTWSAVQRARRQATDLIYTWAGQSAVWGLLAGLPVVYEVHDLPTGRLGPLWFRAFRRLAGQKRYAVITRALREKLEQRFGSLPDSEVVIAPNGVDLEPYAGLPVPESARDQLGLPQGLTVSCAGHLYAGRGVELFLGLADRFPEARFLWVGGRAEDVAAWRARAGQAGLSNVQFTGFIDQRRLPCYQAAADVLLMPYARSIAGSGGGNSADICSPMKMFDYLAAGRAILSSDLPVIHEVLNEGNAMFARPEDLDSWASALGRLLSDEALRRRLSQQALRDARSYTWKGRAGRILSVYEGGSQV